MKTEADLVVAIQRAMRALQELEEACRPLSPTLVPAVLAIKQSTEALRLLAVSERLRSLQPHCHPQHTHPPGTHPPVRRRPGEFSQPRPWIARNSDVTRPFLRKQDRTLR